MFLAKLTSQLDKYLTHFRVATAVIVQILLFRDQKYGESPTETDQPHSG